MDIRSTPTIQHGREVEVEAGQHFIMHSSTVQGAVARSSCDAAFYEIVKERGDSGVANEELHEGFSDLGGTRRMSVQQRTLFLGTSWERSGVLRSLHFYRGIVKGHFFTSASMRMIRFACPSSALVSCPEIRSFDDGRASRRSMITGRRQTPT